MPGRLRWSPALIAGLLLLAVPLLPIVVGPFLVTPEMADVFGDVPNLPPSALHPLGTQSEGRDLLAALMLGTPSTLTIGLIGGGTALL
ncbi:MAG: ABC transporter permease, partial [Mesorhizobium sp.]|nr:ABC transporter permease [Mesorhizobium sp.]